LAVGELTGSVFTQDSGRIRVGWRILFFLVIALIVSGLTSVVLPAGVQAGSFALLLGALVGGWVMLALDGRSPDALGLYVERATARESALGLALGVGIALTVVGVMAASGGVTWSAQEGTMAGWWQGSLAALLFLTLPAAAEEALMRGYPLQALAEAVGAPLALVATSVAFGALHWGNPEVTALGLVNVTAAGLLLGTVYLRTGSLWWATGVHLGWNWAHGYLADLPVSGLEILDAPLYEGVSTGPDWLGGGGFGPEGSALATIVVLVATAVLWWGPWLRPSETALKSKPLALKGHGRTNGLAEEPEEIER
jgi:CAAX protease family protein